MKINVKFLLCSIFIYFTMISGAMSSDKNLAAIYKQLGLSDNISYSADIVIQAKDGKQNNLLKMLFKDGHIRTEGEQAGMKFVMIIKKDGMMYTYNDAMKMWVKTNMGDIIDDKSMPQYKKIKEEVVDGKNCTRYEAEYDESKYKTVIWIYEGMIYKNLNIGPNGEENLVIYSNIKKEALDDSLFSPPQDANVQDMSTLMQNMAQQPPEE